MAAVTICSDFGAPQNKSLTLFPLFPHLFPMKWWDQTPWSSISECWALSQLFHSPLYVIEVKWSEVIQSCLTLCDPMDCSLPGSLVHGIFQARVLEWVAISFSSGSSQPRDWTWVSLPAGRHFYLGGSFVWATKEAPICHYGNPIKTTMR